MLGDEKRNHLMIELRVLQTTLLSLKEIVKWKVKWEKDDRL